jgi:hypothetical protein
METNTKTLKKGWIRFYTIFFIIYGLFSYLLLKFELLYISPLHLLFFGIIEKRFRNGSRDLTWKDLFSNIRQSV